MSSIASLFSVASSQYPGRTALCSEERCWTYAEFDRLTVDLAASLRRRGVQPGDRIAFLLPNGPELVFISWACIKLGAIAVPMNTRLKSAELAYILRHSGSRVCIAAATLAPELQTVMADFSEVDYFVAGDPRPAGTDSLDALTAGGSGEDPGWPEPAPDSPAVILYTSGTTAKPKGATHTQNGLAHAVRYYAEAVDLTETDVVLGMLAMSHVFGFTLQMLAPLSVGATTVVTDRLEPERVFGLIERHRVTHLYGLPVMFDALSTHASAGSADLRSLRHCLAGGDQVTAALSERMRTKLGIELHEGCGMTEVIPYALNRPGIENRIGSIGQPSVGMHLRLVDEGGRDVVVGELGEILVKSMAMMAGYWQDPEATGAAIQDGWLRTGDVGYVDADGYYWFVGRNKEIIKRAGSKISPMEVEDVLSLHNAVQEVAVVGKPDPAIGQRVAAFIVLKPGAQPTAEELIAFCASRIAAYKCPEWVIFVPELPKGNTGKLLRSVLKEWAANLADTGSP